MNLVTGRGSDGNDRGAHIRRFKCQAATARVATEYPTSVTMTSIAVLIGPYLGEEDERRAKEFYC